MKLEAEYFINKIDVLGSSKLESIKGNSYDNKIGKTQI